MNEKLGQLLHGICILVRIDFADQARIIGLHGQVTRPEEHGKFSRDGP